MFYYFHSQSNTHLSTRIQIHSRESRPTRCHVGLLLGKRLVMLLLRHRIRKYPVHPSSTPCGFTFSLEGGLKKISGFGCVWTEAIPGKKNAD